MNLYKKESVGLGLQLPAKWLAILNKSVFKSKLTDNNSSVHLRAL